MALLSGLNQFKMLSKQFSDFHSKIAENADTTFISDRTLQQLQLLNEASLELSFQQTNAQVFSLVTRTLQALFNFDKCYIIKMVDGSPMRMNEHGFHEEQNHAVREKMAEMGQLCLEGSCPPWIQILLEQADRMDISGKAIKDIVLIPISQLGEQASRMETEQSLAWES